MGMKPQLFPNAFLTPAAKLGLLPSRAFTAAEWAILWELPAPLRRAAIARRRVPAMEVQRAAE